MKKLGRRNLALRNVMVSSTMQVVNLFLGFISHTCFLYFLNVEYLGVNGLYSNILSVLSFAELGMGNAFAFSLYEPIAKNDTKKIRILLKLFSKFYKIIGIIIFLLSLLLIPFLKEMVGDVSTINENIVIIYLLFVLNSSISYFFSYKISYLIADQKNYIVQLYTRFIQLILTVVQIIFLWITHSFIIFLLLQIVSTISLNILLSKKTESLYPFIKEKTNTNLEKKEKKEIIDNIKALFWYKIGSVTLNSTDNIIISMLINVKTVGICSTYTLITQQVTKIVSLAINSITPTIGNLSVENNKTKNYEVISKLLVLCIWIYGFLGIMFTLLINDLIVLWLGRTYLLDISVVMSIVFSLYINGVQYPTFAFRTAQGLFKQSKWVPLVASILNIILSIWWGKIIGLTGIFLATGISRLLTTTIIDPLLVFKYNFKSKPWNYYKNYLVGFLIVLINAFIQICLMQHIIVYDWWTFVLKTIIACISTNLMFIILFIKNKNFISIINFLSLIIKSFFVKGRLHEKI